MSDNFELVRSGVPSMAWPMLPDNAGALALAMQFQLEQTQWWPPDELERQQMQQLQLLLNHAHDALPFWRTRLAAAGFRTGMLPTREWLAELPLLTRGEMQTQADVLLCRNPPPQHGKITRGMTSGSTGRPITFYGTELTQFFWRAFTLRDHLWHKRDFSGKLASIRTDVERHATTGWGAATDTAFETGELATLNIRTDVDSQFAWLLQQAPHYVISHPHNLRELALRSIARKAGVPNLREARSFGAVLPADLRAVCREAWGVALTDIYSAAEVGYIALQCPQREHYHIQAENLIVEVLNDDGAPCAPGGVGRVVLSTLHNFAMPLVRYEIGDYAEVGSPCDCGRGLPVITRILGRDRNMLTLPDGTQHWPSFPAELWAAVAPVRQFRLIQKSVDGIEAQYVADHDLGLAQRDQLIGLLQQSLGYPFNIELARVDAIGRSANYKFEDFISELRG